MLDNRHLLPIGTAYTEDGGNPRVFIAGKNGDNALRLLPMTAMKLKWKYFVGVPDIVVCDPDVAEIAKGQYSDKVAIGMTANHESNATLASHKEMPEAETVIIAAPGSVPDRDREIIVGSSTPVIAVSSAVKTFRKPEYCVISDYSEGAMHHLRGADLTGTVGVLSTTVVPGVAHMPWADVTWYTTLPRRAEGIPYCFATEGVITDAVWFAANQLKAKKIIMVGVEQPVTIPNYFWEGMFLQAHCFFYGKHGVKIWNCTPATSVLAGVILGSLEEACQSQSQLRPLN